MAIDTQQKRQAAASVGKVWKGKAIVPGASIDAAQRAHIAWTYPGNALEAPMMAMAGNLSLGGFYRRRRRIG